MKREKKKGIMFWCENRGGVGNIYRDNPLFNPSFDMLPKTKKILK
jgi:hypothetical protein